MSVTARALVYTSNGPPHEVLQIASRELAPPSKDEARIRFLLSPFNPADLLVVSGKYPAQTKKYETSVGSATIGGNEGLAVVEALGEGTTGTDVKVGDRVIMAKLQLGTWTSHANLPLDCLLPIPTFKKAISDESAATLGVNPGTAYRMLKDFVDVEKEKVTVLQNGGNSVVGLMVIQLCKAWGAKSINLVRSRDGSELDKLKDRLKSYGADYVFTYEEVSDSKRLEEIKREIGESNLPRLGINCVGGQVTTDMINLLGENAKLVTYGSLTGQDFAVPTSYLVYKKFVSTGFWWSKWTQVHSRDERKAVTHELVRYIEAGQLKPPDVHVATIHKADSDVVATEKVRKVLKDGKKDAKIVLHVE